MRKPIAALALSATMVAGAGAGIALFGPGPVGADTSPPATSSAPAPEKGQWIDKALAPLVQDGTITQAQEDKVADALVAARPHRHPRVRRAAALQAVADAIGIAPADLRTALRDGQTIAQVAQAHNVDPQHVID